MRAGRSLLLVAAGGLALLCEARAESGPPPAAGPDEMELFQEIPAVIGASKYEQRVSEAPSSVTVLTASDLRRYGYQTLGDVLRGVTSFYVTYDRNYSFVGVRGFGRPGDYNSRILVLIDGHRVNDSVYDGANVGSEGFLELAAIERVEIIRGPSSSLYGTSAFFAVINVLTKRGRDQQGAELSGGWGSFNSYRAILSYGNRWKNGLELYATASAYDSRGQDLTYAEYDSPSTASGRAIGCDSDRYYRFFTSLAYGDLTLFGGWSHREKGIPTGSFGTVFGDPRNSTIDERGFVELRYQRVLRPWVELTGRAYFDQVAYHGRYLYLRTPEDRDPYQVMNHDLADGLSWGAEARATFRVGRWLNLVAGAELVHHVRQHQENHDEEVYLDDTHQTVNAAAFLQATLTPWRWAQLNCGLRYDHYETFGDTANPRCALILSPFTKTSVKLLYGQAFRAPSALELYYHDGGNTQKPGAGLRPEKIHTGEVVVEQQIVDGVRATASFFYNQISGLIDLERDPADDLLQYRNGDNARALGVELGVEAHFAHGWQVRASYSYQDVKNTRTDEWLTNAPRHLAKGNLLVPLIRERLLAGVELQYVGARRTLSGGEAPHYILANLTLSAPNLVGGLSVRASVFNFFDKAMLHPGSTEHLQDVILQDGRTFWLELSYAF